MTIDREIGFGTSRKIVEGVLHSLDYYIQSRLCHNAIPKSKLSVEIFIWEINILSDIPASQVPHLTFIPICRTIQYVVG